ncbi:26S proteasome regulatory subunit rpn6 [Conglomerata obtusa]
MSFENMKQVLQLNTSKPDEREAVIYDYVNALSTTETIEFLKDLPTLWKDISMARTTKIIRQLIANKHENNEKLNMIDALKTLYCDKKLIQLELQAKQIEILLQQKEYQECLQSITTLVKELKKHDDKINLIKLYVCESIAFYELQNNNRARSSLTTARAMAVSTFCPNIVQAQIDMLSGMYICDEKNYETAYGYFLEALDGYILEKSEESCKVIKYLVMCKIVGEKYNEVVVNLNKFEERLINTNFSTTSDRVMQLLLSVNNCCAERDLNGYNRILSENINFVNDSFIVKHLEFLYERLLESNIKKIVEPYKNIKLEYISKMIDLNENVVEDVLRKMILDDKIFGIIDHVGKCLILFENKNKKETECNYAELINEYTDLVQKIKR